MKWFKKNKEIHQKGGNIKLSEEQKAAEKKRKNLLKKQLKMLKAVKAEKAQKARDKATRSSAENARKLLKRKKRQRKELDWKNC